MSITYLYSVLCRLCRLEEAHIHTPYMIPSPLSHLPRVSFSLRGSIRASLPFIHPSIAVQTRWIIPRGQRRSMATIINSPRDPNTLSNYNNWISTHITANFDILFDQKKLAGNVVHRLKSITDAQSQDIILDANHLDIGDVKIDGKQSQWELLPPLESYGTALKIKLGHVVKLNETIEVDVRHLFRIVMTFAFNVNLYKKDLSEDHGEVYSIAMVDACPDLKQKVSLYV